MVATVASTNCGAATQSGLPSHSNQQHSIDRHSMPSSAQAHSAQIDRVMAAAQAAQQVKHACTIDEAELLALRPALLKGYASLQDNSRLAGCTFNNTGTFVVRFCCRFVVQNLRDGIWSAADSQYAEIMPCDLAGCTCQQHTRHCAAQK